jgi:signal transduction histidine kinase
MTQPSHPSRYRASILIAALVALAVWWGLGLPYSMFAWLLDEQQVRWTLICYAWEVPAAGFLGPVLFPMMWWRRIERRWDEVFSDPDHVDPVAAGTVEGMILDYPTRVGWVLLITSLLGYGVGAIQLAIFSQLPVNQLLHVGLLGVVTGLVGGMFAFLYLEGLVAPLLRELGRARPTAPPSGRRVPIRNKVFACSIVLMICTVLLFGTVSWNGGARVLEQESGKRLLVHARHLAHALATEHAPPEWSALTDALDLGMTGRAYVVDGRGRVVEGYAGVQTLDQAEFRPPIVHTILRDDEGATVDRTWIMRIIAFARVGTSDRRVVIVVPRHEFEQELRTRLRTAAVIFIATLILALAATYLFARRLSRPIEIVTAVANRTARSTETPWELAPVRTNDEVGELAVALNDMTSRLGRATEELKRHSVELADRVREATRNITMLYDTSRAVTSSLELTDVLRVIDEQIIAALGLRGLVLLRYSPLHGGADAYASGLGRIETDVPIDLSSLCTDEQRPAIRDLSELRSELPRAVHGALRGPRILCLPLVFKDLLLGVILSSLDADAPPPELELAGALGSQVAIALANVSLYETVRRHEVELFELTERQVQLREETLRDISRELHDGLGQSLTAIKIDLGLIEIASARSTAEELRGQVHEVQGRVTEVIQEVRTLSQLLRPSMLDHLGLVPSIRSLAEGIGGRAGIEIDLRMPPSERRLPPEIEVLLYRVTQEALTNMVKHARARHAAIVLELEPARATLTISDDGVGFDVDRLRKSPSQVGVGLIGMRERVAYHQGWIDIRSQPGAGVRIRLSIPIEAESVPAESADA